MSLVAPVLRYTLAATLVLVTKATLDGYESVAPSPAVLRWRSDVVEAGESPNRQKVEVEKAWLTVPRDWPRAGHMSNLENPQDFNRVMEEFLSRHACASG